MTKHADCLPIYFYDTINKVIGICHSGWKGSFQEIGIKVIEKMNKNYGSLKENILIGIGIGISMQNMKWEMSFMKILSQILKRFSRLLIF